MIFAIKTWFKIDNPEISEKDIDNYFNEELKLFNLLSKEYFPYMYGYFKDINSQNGIKVFEYVDGWNLKDLSNYLAQEEYLKEGIEEKIKKNEMYIEDCFKVKWIFQLINAFHNLQQNKIYVASLDPSDIIITSDTLDIKIVSLGFEKKIKSNKEYSKNTWDDKNDLLNYQELKRLTDHLSNNNQKILKMELFVSDGKFDLNELIEKVNWYINDDLVYDHCIYHFFKTKEMFKKLPVKFQFKETLPEERKRAIEEQVFVNYEFIIN